MSSPPGSPPPRRRALFRAIAVLASLTSFLRSGGRKVEAWQATLARADVPFDGEAAAFRNINTPGELAASAP